MVNKSKNRNKALRRLMWEKGVKHKDVAAELGIHDIESTEILKQNPFTKYGKPARIAALFGGNDKYRAALKELENELYKVA